MMMMMMMMKWRRKKQTTTTKIHYLHDGRHCHSSGSRDEINRSWREIFSKRVNRQHVGQSTNIRHFEDDHVATQKRGKYSRVYLVDGIVKGPEAKNNADSGSADYIYIYILVLKLLHLRG